ncbi:tRNA (guanine-N(7)-)-methyltransferase non-catalytic subunit trm82 [Penicillium subrubescens]|uniref:tRNA (Guanine-N(7)-)-methyltransferase non-catalytic subunit trm82 n=1 Tax=Penicillium subrubescens TaxID=1316194 RepID=A0A1Q5UJ12_9EURO|nr:tRNA (guanine-N(7)-)-methyltransferase non-catalytic subunit trm82 [Penicillium subrubescens]KAJ5911828.1 tRNA (guanine-N(7)-)-methyltransferase non-catalytic subunit trm82 [Penicillium subrubescens]OKP12467.1 tRNA (guanine-N(7)-)-methyltransferase non-catalytic subunit trm82 [Penicillium subrubescens]
MASFQHPIQSLELVKRQSQGLSNVLVASAGPHIYSYAAESGQRLDVWPQHVETSRAAASGPTSTSEDQAPPEKRIKLSSPETESEGKPSANNALTWTNIPMVLATSDGRHVVVLTAEDKCIRVFSLSEDGKFKELSSRNMAKKPCALDLTPDDQTILCADKFGDVYSLPLIPGEYVKPKTQAKKPKPVATTLTVHSKRNLRSLEQQHLHAERAEKAEKVQEESEEKGVLNFEHQLILGHVSMLTDVIAVSLPGAPGSRPRNYILTADRDEHIRVSRGIPQAHVIEQQCFGHTSLISKLCIPSWAPNVLISGGGDGHLLVWNWSEGQVHQSVPLGDSFQDAIISGIWDVSFDQSAGTPGSINIVLIGLEGSPQLLCYTLESDNTLKSQGVIQLSGNVLDLTTLDSNGSIVVSVDAVRAPGSTDTWKESPASAQILTECLQISITDGGLKWAVCEDSRTACINAGVTSGLSATLDAKQKKAIDDTLYNLGNLRKRTFDD